MLSEFRARLVAGAAETLLPDAVLEIATAHQLLKAGGRQRTDSTHVLATAWAMSRIECVHETLRHALDVLALAAPEWLLLQVLPHWAEAYEGRASDDRLPRSAAKRTAWVQQIGEDGHHLLAALTAYPMSTPSTSHAQQWHPPDRCNGVSGGRSEPVH